MIQRLCIGLVVSVAVFIGAETQAQMRHANHDLGVVEFPVSCSKPAQNEFTHAVALLHHMTYPQAREAFQHVETIDSRCAMAYWGEGDDALSAALADTAEPRRAAARMGCGAESEIASASDTARTTFHRGGGG